MRTVLVILLIVIPRCIQVECQIVEILIWDKDRNDFIDLRDTSRFDDVVERATAWGRDSRTGNITGKVLKVSYYEETDLVMFRENDTKVTGICGDIWNLLADHLKFTLVPIKYRERDFGIILKNGSYSGLMGLLERNETQVIMRTAYYAARAQLLGYSMPLWITRLQAYIRPEYKSDNRWIITVFAPQTWIAIVILFLGLSVAGYMFQVERHRKYKKTKRRLRRIREHFTFNDHVFYTYSMMCNQGYIPDAFHRHSKILTISKIIFAWLILLNFSSNLIIRMKNRTFHPSFNDLHDLMNTSDYIILSLNGSMWYEFLKNYTEQETLNGNPSVSKHFRFMDDPNLMRKEICRPGKYALMENDDISIVRDNRFCRIIPIKHAHHRIWIGFALPKRFPYKNIINVSILRLHEAGIIDVLKQRWLKYISKNVSTHSYRTINLNQMYLIFCIPIIGFIVSWALLIFENVVYHCKNRRE